MSDAPEHAWLDAKWDNGRRPEATVDKWDDDDVLYRRADLPATDAQIAAHPKVRALVEALRPFSDMCSEMFVRNWNRPDVAIALDGPEGLHRLTFGDFLDLHAALAAMKDEMP